MSARLDRLTELEQAGTPGPWRVIYESRWEEARIMLPDGTQRALLDGRQRGNEEVDATLIAESRNALPALIAVARAAKVVSDGFAMLEPAEDNPLADLAIALARLDADPAGEEA